MVDNTEDGDVVGELVVGTYQEFLIGYKLIHDKTKETYSLKQSFTNHSHAKSVRTIAAIGKYVASGSADETIKLINLETRAEHGTLQPETGSITCLTTFGPNYLFSGGQDGSICIWRSGAWRCEKTFKRAHEKGVTGITVHPSGKLALSIGEDKSLKTWNLIKGRKGYVTNLRAVADCIEFTPDGQFYAVGVSNRVDVYKLETAQVVYSIPFGKRVSCLAFRDDQVLMVAGDHEYVEVHDITNSKKLTSFPVHKNRVKDMKYYHSCEFLITVSNDGFIKVWDFPHVEPSISKFSSPPTLVAEADTACRIICLALWTKALIPKEGEEAESSPEESEVDEELATVMEKVREKKKKLKLKKIASRTKKSEATSTSKAVAGSSQPQPTISPKSKPTKELTRRQAKVTTEIDTSVESKAVRKKLKKRKAEAERESKSTPEAKKVKKNKNT